jgi:uncharacterized protein with NRDE domain
MCLILVAWRCDEKFPLVVAANRDEFHARPSAAAAFWHGGGGILAGRDLEAGGTWLGVTRSGRFAAVTNARGGRDPNARESRGLLTRSFLEGEQAPQAHVAGVAARGADYSGFNLLAADGDELWWYSNRDGEPRRLDPGVYGLANELLDSADVAPAKARFAAALVPAPATEALFAVLAHSRIASGPYGTRCSSTLIAADDGRWRFAERSFDAEGRELTTVHFAFAVPG